MPVNSKLKREKKITAGVGATVSTADNLTITAIFTMLSNEIFAAAFSTAKLILFPLAGIWNLIHAGITIREAQLHNWKRRYTVEAIVESVGAVAIGVACAGAYVAALATAGPFIFAAVMAAKTLYNFGSAIYYGIKSHLATDETEKTKYRHLAIGNAIRGGALTLAAVGIVGVLILGKAILAPVVITGTVIGAIAGVFKAVQYFRAAHHVKKEPLLVPEQDSPKSTAKITQQIAPKIILAGPTIGSEADKVAEPSYDGVKPKATRIDAPTSGVKIIENYKEPTNSPVKLVQPPAKGPGGVRLIEDYESIPRAPRKTG